MSRYTGLPDALRREVFERDRHRCRWCGATNQGLDIHHIEYRRGHSYDRLENLISLCRNHHSFVHGIPNAQRQTIIKSVAQMVLKKVNTTPGSLGNAEWRHLKRAWEKEGRCQTHGVISDECLICIQEDYWG